MHPVYHRLLTADTEVGTIEVRHHMSKKPPIVIIHNEIAQDAPEDVLDILRQSAWIAEVLREEGYQVRTLPFSIASIAAQAPAFQQDHSIIMNLVDASPHHEDLVYLVPGILASLQLPYTGCSLESLFLTTDKILTKRHLHAYGIATPQWLQPHTPTRQQQFTPGSWLVKPSSDDASQGIDEKSLVQATEIEQVLAEMDARQIRTGRPHYAEQYIEGREFTVCLYGAADNPVAMAPYEWVFEGFEERNLPKMFTFAAKWDDSCYAFDHIVARHSFGEEDKPLLGSLRELATSCWHACKLSGYARIDFRIDQSGKAWVLEANGNPSFYGFFHSAAAMGIPFGKVVETIVTVADTYHS